MIQVADIERMSLVERLQTMELLWSSIARTPETAPTTPSISAEMYIFILFTCALTPTVNATSKSTGHIIRNLIFIVMFR